MTDTPRAADPADQINRLQKRIGALEHQAGKAMELGALGALLIAGATLVVIGLGLPWISTDGRPEFSSMTQSGWATFAGDSVGLLVLLAVLVLIGLAVAGAVSQSRPLHLLTHVLADLVCLLPIALMLSALREGSTVVPRAGCYTILIGALAIAVSAWIRRGRLEQ